MTTLASVLPPAAAGARQAETTSAAEVDLRAPAPSKQIFLELLIAQIRHQNPLEPIGGTEFLSQLAEFSALEQLVAIREELASLKAALDAARQENSQS